MSVQGESTAEISAPIADVWAVIQDVESAPAWQGGMKTVTAVERDADGRATVCDVEVDGRARTLRTRVRFAYAGPDTLSWSQVKGDVKALQGSWELHDLGGERTRARYWIEVDLGRLGLIIRGPILDAVRGQLAQGRAEDLRRRIEDA